MIFQSSTELLARATFEKSSNMPKNEEKLCSTCLINPFSGISGTRSHHTSDLSSIKTGLKKKIGFKQLFDRYLSDHGNLRRTSKMQFFIPGWLF